MGRLYVPATAPAHEPVTEPATEPATAPVHPSPTHTSWMQSSDVPAPTARVVISDVIDALRAMPSASVHAVVTDPPYAIDKAGKMLGQVSANYHVKETHSRGYADNDPDVLEEWFISWATELERVLVPGGHIIAFGGTRAIHRLASGIEKSGFSIRDQIIWIYGTGTPKGPRMVGPDGQLTGWASTLKPSHEPAVLARKGVEKTIRHTYATYGTAALHRDALAVKVDGESDRIVGNVFIDDYVHEALGRVGKYFYVAKPSSKERPSVDGIKHDTVKPLALMVGCIELICPPGGIVLDPFAGSGTTLEAAVLSGRRCVGIELEAKFLPLIEQRLHRVGLR